MILLISLQSLSKESSKEYLKSDLAKRQESKELEYYNNVLLKEKLAKIKFEIIRGNTYKANELLAQAKYTNGFSQGVQYRYKALSLFVDSKYIDVIDTLKHKTFNLTKNYQKICSIKTFSYLALRKFELARKEWKKCFKTTYLRSKSTNIWLDSFVNNKNFKPSFIRETFKRAEVDSLRLILKLAIYLNQQGEILKYLSHISTKTLADLEIRELIAFSYYKQGEIIKAYEFLKDIKTGNLLNVKGNLLLLQNKNEMAYAQFKMAFKKKNTSQNALKRLVPLSWLYKQWDDALIYSSNIQPVSSNNRFFQAAVLIQKGKYKDSNNILLYEIKNKSKNYDSKNINLLVSYNFLSLKRNSRAKRFIEKACIQNDGLSCLYQFHLSYWDNFSKIIANSKKIKRSDLIEKYKSQKVEDPIKDREIINQRNLELLDKQQGYI